MTPNPADCQYFALLECVDTDTCWNTMKHFRSLRHGTLTAENNSRIMICEVPDHELERFVVVLFNGDYLAGYSAFFTWCEEHLHEVALIRVGSYDSGHQTWDPLDIALLQERYSMAFRSDYFVRCERHLIKEFISRVALGNYSTQTLQRIINMCCIGPDPNQACALALGFLQRWEHSNDLEHWVRCLRDCHTVGHSGPNWTEGGSLLARVLGHLVYAEYMLPTPRRVRKALQKQGVRKMSLER